MTHSDPLIESKRTTRTKREPLNAQLPGTPVVSLVYRTTVAQYATRQHRFRRKLYGITLHMWSLVFADKRLEQAQEGMLLL
jgi:hypothetical protein